MTHMDSVKELAQLLLSKKWKISTAESCTGGMISASMTDLAGSSDWFERGYITYSNKAKIDDIQVPRDLIDQHGAVSTQVATAMALGALAKSASNCALSVTGVAGPSGGSIEKPIGFVCFAWSWKDSQGSQCICESIQLIDKNQPITSQTRNQVRTLATKHALERAYEIFNQS